MEVKDPKNVVADGNGEDLSVSVYCFVLQLLVLVPTCVRLVLVDVFARFAKYGGVTFGQSS